MASKMLKKPNANARMFKKRMIAKAIKVTFSMDFAATCGFRVFVPLLFIAVASQAGYVQLADGFTWMQSEAAVVVFSIATFLEVVAYIIPFFDNLLDVIAAPFAVIAGSIVSASFITNVEPLLQ
jgi:hypothetical protein